MIRPSEVPGDCIQTAPEWLSAVKEGGELDESVACDGASVVLTAQAGPFAALTVHTDPLRQQKLWDGQLK